MAKFIFGMLIFCIFFAVASIYNWAHVVDLQHSHLLHGSNVGFAVGTTLAFFFYAGAALVGILIDAIGD